MTSFPLSPPIAAQKPYAHHYHNQSLDDPYHWLRDPSWPDVKDPEVLDYVAQENAYSDQLKTMHQATYDLLYTELTSRIRLEDQSVPIKDDDYYYYTRTVAEGEYPIYCRRKSTLDAPEEIILDANELAKGHNFFHLGTVNPNPTHRLLGYSVDVTGDERYVAYVKDLATGVLYPDVVENTNGPFVWHHGDKEGFYYRKVNEAFRTKEVFFHALGTPSSQDVCIYHEADDVFEVIIHLSASKQMLLIDVSSFDSHEWRYVALDQPDHRVHLVVPRAKDHHYALDHQGAYWWIRSNDMGKNFRLARATLAQLTDQSQWETVIAHSDTQYIADMSLYAHHVVALVKEKGLGHALLIDEALRRHEKRFEAPSYALHLRDNDFHGEGYRLFYSSPIEQPRMYEIAFDGQAETMLKHYTLPVPFDESAYRLERIWIAARDGVEIPVTLCYKAALRKKEGNPLYLCGYGAYGFPYHANFTPSMLSMIDRGFIYAIAHVRGGGDLGFQWYEGGKFLKKKNTFSDFIACSEGLIARGYTTEGNITAYSGSAGGLLMGTIANEAPHLFRAIIADVPFVDMLNTMMDESLPLTPGEYKEWGNPNDPDYFEYMRSYSPYENVKAQDYPALLVLAGLHDPRVTYWEAAKWVAKLRAVKTDSNPLLLITNMGAGHMGDTGRFKALEERAYWYLFVLWVYGMV